MIVIQPRKTKINKKNKHKNRFKFDGKNEVSDLEYEVYFKCLDNHGIGISAKIIDDILSIVKNILLDNRPDCSIVDIEEISGDVFLTVLTKKPLLNRDLANVYYDVNKILGTILKKNVFVSRFVLTNTKNRKGMRPQSYIRETFTTGLGSVGMGGVISGGKGQGVPKVPMTFKKKKFHKSPSYRSKKVSIPVFRNHD